MGSPLLGTISGTQHTDARFGFNKNVNTNLLMCFEYMLFCFVFAFYLYPLSICILFLFVSSFYAYPLSIRIIVSVLSLLLQIFQNMDGSESKTA